MFERTPEILARSNVHKKTERNAEMARRVLAGEVLERIAEDYGITRQRVRMIVKPMIGERAWRKSRVRVR